jgi:hypothetical protein
MNFHDRTKRCIAPSRRGKAEGHDLRTKHRNLTDPNHRGRKIVVHGRSTHETSSHRHGLTDLAMSGTKGTTKTKKQRSGIMLYPQGLQNASAQRIQATSRSAKVRWIIETRVLANKLPPSGQDTRGLQSKNYAKFASTPHRRRTVLVEKITQRIHWKLEWARKIVHWKF